jgi:hypothetical protein
MPRTLGKIARLAEEGRQRALLLPLPARMAEVTFQVTRADGTLEPPRTFRTYRSPVRRWLWAIKSSF